MGLTAHHVKVRHVLDRWGLIRALNAQRNKKITSLHVYRLRRRGHEVARDSYMNPEPSLQSGLEDSLDAGYMRYGTLSVSN
jgi:hypothetical protein